MFERFTERARLVVVLAQEEARALGHNYIGTEHILLGLLREEDGLAAHVLKDFGIDLDRVRVQITRIVGPGEEVTSGQIPFTPRAKKVLEIALREALSLAHNYIGTEHILLGLSRENDGVAARIMVDLDADADKVRSEVLRRLGSGTIRVPSSGPLGAGESFWLGGLGRVLHVLEGEIEQQLDRLPDSGDLLLTLASAPTTRAAAALQAMGLDLDALAREVERARQSSGPSSAELTEALRRAEGARQTAVAAQEYETAAELRDEEKRLRAALETAGSIDAATMTAIRARLGLPLPGGPASGA